MSFEAFSSYIPSNVWNPPPNFSCSMTGKLELLDAATEANSNLSKEWINMELERLKSEYQIKSQIATMLRSTLAGMETQHVPNPRQSSPRGGVNAN